VKCIALFNYLWAIQYVAKVSRLSCRSLGNDVAHPLSAARVSSSALMASDVTAHRTFHDCASISVATSRTRFERSAPQTRGAGRNNIPSYWMRPVLSAVMAVMPTMADRHDGMQLEPGHGGNDVEPDLALDAHRLEGE
jgi:hypothetical protein